MNMDYNAKRQISRIVTTVSLPEATVLSLADIECDDGSKVDVTKLREHFRAEGKIQLDAAIAISRKAAALFKQEKNVLELTAPVTMFGDIHGQYLDLVNKTSTLPYPTPNDPWLFLGDYVDRGAFGVEVVLYLFAMKVQNPTAVYLIRGNHECRHLTNAYNFKKECLAKYKSLEFYESVMIAFDNLPLAALVEGGNGHRFLCVHGGLSPDIKTIQDIENLNRFCEPPQQGAMCDLLWSDPLEDGTAANLQPSEMEEWYAVEFFENENRGAGYIFGYTAVMEFLKTNNLSTLIRAHDVQRTGYSEHFMHCKENRRLPLVITLFSAPNYCGYYGNEAAILRLEPALLEGIPDPTELTSEVTTVVTMEVTTDNKCNIISGYDESSDSHGDQREIELRRTPQPEKRSHVNSPRDATEEITFIESEEVVAPPPEQTVDSVSPYFPKLIYTRYDWVLDVPYWLPSFENGFQYSMPFIIEQMQEILQVMIPTQEEIDILPNIPVEPVTPPPAPKPTEPKPDPVISTPPPASPQESVSNRDREDPDNNFSPRRPLIVNLVEWQHLRRKDPEPVQRRVSDRIKTFETHRRPVVLRSGDAMKRRKSVEALIGSFKDKMVSYLSVVNLSTQFDKIKNENRKSEFRPPIGS